MARRSPKGTGAYRVGKPYVIAGRTYYPAENPNYKAMGVASWYGDEFHGRLTANGEVFGPHLDFRRASDAAHAVLCARHQYQEQQVDHRARQ